VGDAGLEKPQKSTGKTRVGSVSGAQSGAVGADSANLAVGDRSKIVEGFAGLPVELKRSLVDAAWQSLPDRLKGQILHLVAGMPDRCADR
jgi:hypothetical protein